MSLSFKDSLEKNNEVKPVVATESATVATFNVEDMNVEPFGVTTLDEDYGVAAYAGDDGNWTQHSGYTYYSSFYDDNLSVVNDKKEISLNDKQINITQEENSQFIPFEMPRYYDGYDLTDASLSIHYETKNGRHGSSKPINVTYNNEKIRFGWLVDAGVTLEAGKLKFEIHAYGTVRGNDGVAKGYVWKTKTNENLNVLQSLCDCEDVVNKIDDTWIQELVSDVAEKVAKQIAEANVGGQVVRAEDAAVRAESAANNAESIATTTVTNALSDYSTTSEMQSYVSTEIANADIDGKLTEYAKTSEVKELIGDIGESENVIDYIDDVVAGVDVTEQLKDYAKTEDVNSTVLSINNNLQNNYYTKTETNEILESYATKENMSEAIAEADISDKLNDYYKKSEIYSKDEVDNVVANVRVDLTGYATETYVENKMSPLRTDVDNNTSDITNVKSTIATINQTLDSIDKSPNAQYETTYNEPFVFEGEEYAGENMLVLYEIYNKGKENETRSVISSHEIKGGSGGVISTSKIERITPTPIIKTLNDDIIIKYKFTNDDTGVGYATWKIGSETIINKKVIYAGEIEEVLTEHLGVGSDQKITLIVTDDSNTIQQLVWYVSVIDVKLESNFDDTRCYEIDNPVNFTFTPYGAVNKIVHFKLDGEEIGTKISSKTAAGLSDTYTIPAEKFKRGHGSYLLETYMTAQINDDVIESNHIYKDIIWYDTNSKIPVIGTIYQDFTVRQYEATNIEYTVYDPNTEMPVVEISVDGNTPSTYTLESPTNIYTFKTDVVDEHIVTITCGNTTKTLKINVVKLNIDVKPVSGLAFDFNPSGKSNNDTDRLWSDGTVQMSVSPNFDWVNGGYQYDENGDQYFCVKAGTTATFDYELFANDAKIDGKEFKVIFKTTNIKNRNTSFISCMDNGIGLDMKVENANIYSSNSSLYSPYCEEDIIEFEFNINASKDIPLVMTYEDGVANRPMIYTSDASFWQQKPQPITIGCKDCDVYIYRMKAYTRGLSDSDILSNFILDARNADEMVNRYTRNQIYTDKDGVKVLTPEGLANACPDLRIITIDAPIFTTDKDTKVSDTTVRMIYKNGRPEDNWTCTNAKHSGQGTSSNEYGYAGRNIDLIMDGSECWFTFEDEKMEKSKTITLTEDSVPTDYLNIKVNIASSENQNNAQMARRYNKYNPFVRSAKFNDDKIKDCMEFYNCVVFIKENDKDIANHIEFKDTEYHFYAIGNVGDSKKTDDTRVNDKDDPKECVVEIADYNVPLAEFPTGNGKNICRPDDWREGNAAYDLLYAPYQYKEGKFKSFGSKSYEFRYEMKGITEEQRQDNIDAWRDMYKFVVTSTNEDFYNKLKEYFVVNSALYYYLFTERYTMVDNRAKNSFWHYGKVYITEATAQSLGDAAGGFVIDDEQAAIRDGYRWDLSFGYDFDTSLGIDNTGKLVLTYGKEDKDYYVDGDPSSSYIYRAAESTFFCRLRDLFSSEMQAMFVNRESEGAWSAKSLIKQWDDAQNQFPEELWRLDIQRKYIRTYIGSSIDNSIAGATETIFLPQMMNGRKKYQRRMFERNQELYMATKYFGTTATQDQIRIRFNNPESYVVEPDFTLHLTPYSDMYIGVSFYNGHRENFRAKAGVEYEVKYPENLDSSDITLIYGASFIQAIGDLSKCYVGDNDFSKATRLQRLVIGSNIDGYSNSYMKILKLGNNRLLEYLDVRNVTGLSEPIDLSQCGNMLELYGQGSGTTGVIFANGGKIKKFYLPSIVSLTARNLSYIQDYDIESYNNLQTLIVENTPIINTYNIVNSSPMLQSVRLVGINWSIENTETLEHLISLRGHNSDGNEISQSVLIGSVFIPTIEQKEYNDFATAWSDLEITYNTMVLQHPVTFVNEDGTILDIQYVDEGEYAVDPTTREDNPIAIPTKESTVSTEYTFAGWDNPLTSQIFAALTVTATFSESTRSYTIRYVSKSASGTIVKQESVGLYGENIPYDYETYGIPTYTYEENAYNYYLFNRWDKSGIIDGDKTVTAIFDSFKYTGASSFAGKDIGDLSPVEIYALTKLTESGKTPADFGMSIEVADPFSFTMGYDIDFDDIESTEIISEKTTFNGTNYIDTGINLFDEDKDFILALDYTISSDNSEIGTLMQCFQASGSNGFKLGYNGSASEFIWGSSSIKPSSVGNREMLVIRHKKGDDNLYVYVSGLNNSVDFTLHTINKASATHSDNATLIFGAAKMDSGRISNYCMGDIHWCKIWYQDLGEKACEELVGWIHEKITLGVSGFYRYPLYDDGSKETMVSLVASHLLDRKMQYNTTNTNAGGWAQSNLNRILNTRFYNAIPVQIRLLLKKVCVLSTIGNNSTSISESGCYITIPSVYDVDNTKTTYKNELYTGASTIQSMATKQGRRREFRYGFENDNVNAYETYWLRSPALGYTYYAWQVLEEQRVDSVNKGITNPYGNANTNYGVVIEISF